MSTKFLLSILLAALATLVLCGDVTAQSKKRGMTSITDDNGNVSEGKMKKGKKTGEWRTTNRYGNLFRIETYSKGELHGTIKEYNGDGSPHTSVHYVYGRLNGSSITFNAMGDTAQLLTYRNDTLNGIFVSKVQHYIRTQGFYVNGQKEGLWVERNSSNASAYTIDSTYYHNGVMHGPHRFYKNGKLLGKSYFVNGEKEGGDTSFYLTGSLDRTAFYHNGLPDSVHREYDRSGSVLRETWYHEGIQMRYDSVWTMQSGKRVLYKAVQYNTTGELTYAVKYNKEGGTQYSAYAGADALIDSVLDFEDNLQKKLYFDQQIPDNQKRLASYQEWRYDTKTKQTSHGLIVNSARNGKWIWTDSAGHVIKEIVFEKSGHAKRYTSYYANGKLKISGVCSHSVLNDSIHAYTSAGKELKAETPQYDQLLKEHFETETDVRYEGPRSQIVLTQHGGDRDYGDYDIIVPSAEPEMPQEMPQTMKSEVLVFAEEMPKFPGDSLTAFITKTLVYPEQEKAGGKTGTVYVNFIVRKDGSLTDIKVIKPVNGAPGFSSEAVRLIKAMPKWIPGRMNGRAVDVSMTIPVKFEL